MYFKSDQRTKNEERWIGMYFYAIQREIVNQALKKSIYGHLTMIKGYQFAGTSAHFAVFS